DASANAPKIAIDATPSMPVLPGQSVLLSVRASGFADIAGIRVEQQDADNPNGPWKTVTLNGAGQATLLPSTPGVVTIRVTATDSDGFTSTRTSSILVRDPNANAAP